MKHRPKFLATESAAPAVIALVFGLFLMFIFVVAAVAKPVDRAFRPCATLTMAKQVVRMKFPGMRTQVLQGEDALLFMDGYNSVPPKTSHKATAQLIMYMNANDVRIVFFWHGCIVARSTLPAPVVRKIMANVGVLM